MRGCSRPMHSRQQAKPVLTFLVMDVSFISATLLLGPVFAAAPGLREAVILVKPQFEAGRGHVGKGGIVRDPAAHQLAVDRVAACVRELRWRGGGDHPFSDHREQKGIESSCFMRAACLRPETHGPYHSRQSIRYTETA